MGEKEKTGFAWQEFSLWSTFLQCKVNDVWNRNPKAQPYVYRWCLNLIILAILIGDWESQKATWDKPSFNTVLAVIKQLFKKEQPKGGKKQPRNFQQLYL